MMESAEPKQKKPEEALKFTKDLTDLAEKGHLDPVIGRDKEIRRLIQVLSRRRKNNPVLIGEPGVGKTAIVEGLALRIINKDVPDILLGKKVLSLDLPSMVAGAMFQGQFEERLKTLIQTVEKSHGQIILFIDELHNLIGAGKSGGAMDAGQILKPPLARGELKAIGATTVDEYRKFIEKDRALERRFQVILVEEPVIEDAITILRGLKEKYEVHHGVRIKDSALVAAVQLSHRYIADRFLPDKAIDLIDEAASQLSIEVNSMPDQLDELRRTILQLKVEKASLSKETDLASKERLSQLKKELAKLSKENDQLTEKYQAEKTQLMELKQTKKEIDQIKIEMDRSQREGRLQKAAELKYGLLPKQQQKRVELEKKILKNKTSMLKEEVGFDEVAEVVSRWTGIPVERVAETQAKKLLNIENTFRKSVVGQNHALEVIAHAVRRARSGVSDPHKPVGTFMFLGPTGVGKTQTAKTLARFLFDSEEKITRIDMSEYGEKHSKAKLIGAPPGYVGYEEGGQLTEYVRRHPYSVILFDEIEKAHPEVFHVLLPLFDEGRLTDGHGRTVDFKNCILIMTSNVGSEELSSTHSKEVQKKVVMEKLGKIFRPEFLNRVDEFVCFHPLKKEDMSQIVQIHLDQVKSRLMEKKVELKFHPSAVQHLAEKGYDPTFGARPLKRAIQSELLNPLSQEILSGKIPENSFVEVKAQSKGLVFAVKTLVKKQAG